MKEHDFDALDIALVVVGLIALVSACVALVEVFG